MAQLYFAGSATSADVLTGKSFSAGTNYISSGTMPNNGALNLTPGATAISIPSGYTSGGSVAAVANLLSANIKYGITVGDVAGMFKGFAASGTTSISSATAAFSTGNNGAANRYFITVSGLSFTPLIVSVLGTVLTTSHINTVTLYQNTYHKPGTGSINTIDILGLYFTEGSTSVSPTSTELLSTEGGRAGYVNSSGFCLPIPYSNSTYTPGAIAYWYAIGSVF